MGTVLGLIAVRGRAGLAEFDAHYQNPAVADFRRKVQMVLDREVDAAYPARWIGKVTVETVDGRSFDGRVDEPMAHEAFTTDAGVASARGIRCVRLRTIEPGKLPPRTADPTREKWTDCWVPITRIYGAYQRY